MTNPPLYAEHERRDAGGGRKLSRYAVPLTIGLVAVVLLVLAAACVWIGVSAVVDPSSGDESTFILIPFGLVCLAAPGFALAWVAFKSWPVARGRSAAGSG